MDSTSDRIAQVVEPAIEAEGYALVDVELKGKGRGRVLRIFIDKTETGITLDDCQKVSELLDPMLDVEDIARADTFSRFPRRVSTGEYGRKRISSDLSETR